MYLTRESCSKRSNETSLQYSSFLINPKQPNPKVFLKTSFKKSRLLLVNDINIEQIIEYRFILQLMDIQDNQLVQSRQDSQRHHHNNPSSSSPSIVKEENNPVLLDKQQLPDSPDPQPRLPISNSELPENAPNFSLPAIRSEPVLVMRQEKSKRRKVRAYVQDFTDYLPQSLLIINKTVIPPLVRKGERYQVNIPSAPPLKSAYRPMEEWLVWNGSSHPELVPTEEQLLRFKELLGENRTEEELIHLRLKLGMNTWREVLEYIGRNKGQLRRIFHVAQRNRH